VIDTFENQLEALRQRFRLRAVAESGRLETLVSDLEGAGDEPAARTEVRRIAHSLSGAAGTFGYSQVGLLACELEDFASDGSPSPRLASACRALLSEINRIALQSDEPFE
jgi:chemotaxis protein histidine kinase CheA